MKIAALKPVTENCYGIRGIQMALKYSQDGEMSTMYRAPIGSETLNSGTHTVDYHISVRGVSTLSRKPISQNQFTLL